MKHSTASREEDVAVKNDIVQVALYRPPPDQDAYSSPSAGTIPGGSRQHTYRTPPRANVAAFS
jgi:ethanolamine utilization microcompartment shell protein EutL